MRLRTGFLIGLAITLMLFFAGTATAQRCEKVNAHMSDYVDYSAEPACTEAGYVFCAKARIVGTINGEQLALDTGGGEWTYHLPPEIGDTVIWRGPVTYIAKHGEIWTDAVGMNFLLVWQTLGVGRIQETELIVGGTGRYEGATGVIVAQWEGPDVVIGELSGEICWPEE
jgi:hypothetical protein